MAPIVEHLFNPAGRIGRKTFLITAAGFLALGIVCTLIPVVGQIVSLAMLWPWTVVAIKRLHDMNRGGAIAIVMALASAGLGVIGSVVAMLSLSPGLFLAAASVMAVLGLVIGLAALAFMVWLAVAPGSAGSNRFGHPEKISAFPAPGVR